MTKIKKKSGQKPGKAKEENRQASPLEQKLQEARAKKGYAFIPYLAAGDPDWQTSEALVKTLIEAGADSMEIGLPFTDPVADGPVLQRAFKRVLSTAFELEMFFGFLERIKKNHPDFPLVVMGYANIFYHMGFKKIFNRLSNLNVVGVVIPDIPFEEKRHIIEKEGLQGILEKISWVDFITPTVTEDRLDKICRYAQGFLYFVSTKGVTGQSNFSLKPWAKIIARIRKKTSVPVITGFGIRNADHAMEAIHYTDGFIIGSRIHEVIEESLSEKNAIAGRLKEDITKRLSAVRAKKT